MTSYSQLRKNKKSSIDNIKKKFETKKSSNYITDDETYWNMKHIRGDDGKGTAIIRLLPASEGEEDPFVRYEEYSVTPGGFGTRSLYWNRNRQLLDGKDPVFEYHQTIWEDNELTDDQKLKKLWKLKKFWICNIYVIKDPNKPENEGKVFKWKFGPQIYNIIYKKLFPEYETDKEINVFEPFEGANFLIKVGTKQLGKNKVPTYEDSSFMENTESFCTEDEFDVIWGKQYKLAPLVDESTYKSYEQLKEDFDKAYQALNPNEEMASAPVSKPVEKVTESAPSVEKSEEEVKPVNDVVENDSSDDDLDDFFNSLEDDKVESDDIPF